MANSSNIARGSSSLLAGSPAPRSTLQGRQLCVRPSAIASPDVKADDTAEARRRLARQFRKHKLQPQPTQPAAGSAPSSGLTSPYYSSQLVRPRARVQPPPFFQEESQLWQQQQQQQDPPAGGAFIGQLHPADAAAAAAARELLEWQFQLEPEAGSLGSSTGLQAGADADPAAASGHAAAQDLLQLPSALLPGLSTAGAGFDAGKQLTKAIMRASHWRQVQSLVQEHAPEMLNTTHLCAALTRMVYLQPTFHSSSSARSAQLAQPSAALQQQEQGQEQGLSKAGLFLQQLYDSIHERRETLSYRQACNVLWAAGKLRHSALPGTDCLVDLYTHARQACTTEQRQLEQQQQQQSEEGSAQAAQAREQHLAWRASAFSHAGQLVASLVCLQQVLPAQQLQDTTAWVMSTTRDLLQDHIQQHQPAPGQRAGSKQQAQQAPQQQQQQQPGKPCQRPLPARDVANLAASLAKLGARPSPAWLSAFAAALGCKGLIYIRSYRDLSQLLWATAMFSKDAAEGSAAANSVQAAAAALLYTAQALPLSSCDGQALANTLWALATLGQRPPLPWLNRVLQHAEAAAARGFLSAQGVSMTLWALAALAVVPQASCLSALLAAAQQHVRHMTPQGCSNVLWALAVLERPPGKDWLAGFWTASRTLLPQMTAQGLVNCMWAAARLKLQPPQEWVGDVAGLLLQQGVGSLTRQGLSNTVWALSHISITCRAAHELLQSCLEEAARVLQQQWQQQQQQQQQEEVQAAADADSSNSSTGSSGGFNIYELSGLLHAVCCLRLREASQPTQQPQHADAAAVSASSSFDGAAAGGCDLLSQLTLLLQEVSTPLLPTAGTTELSIMLWSQVAMPIAHINPSGSSNGAHFAAALQQGAAGLTGAAATPSNSTPSSPTSSSSGSSPAAPSSTCSSSSRPSQLVIPRKWMLGWFAATRSSFSAASSRDLSCWVWCLAKKGAVFKPHEQWMASWQVASYRQLGRASSQDLSNMLWALASLGITPEPAWLQQHMQEVHRRQLQKQVAPQHYGNIGWALAKMGHRPDRSWAERYQEDVFRLLPAFKPQELTNVLWAMAVLNMKVPEELLSEVKSHMASLLPAYKVNEVAVSMWALARLKAQPGLRLMAAALQHCFSQARLLTPTGLSMLMWSVGNMETAPPKAWVAKLLVATQVRMSGFSAQELSNLAVSLARLEYRPPDSWLDTFAAATAARMHSFEAQALANTLWALATLHYTPSEAWMNAFDAQLARHVHSCTPAHIAMTLWALSRLQWLPAEPLLQQLQERAEIHSGSYLLSSRRMLARAVRVLQKVESEDEEDGAQQQQQQQQQQHRQQPLQQ